MYFILTCSEYHKIEAFHCRHPVYVEFLVVRMAIWHGFCLPVIIRKVFNFFSVRTGTIDTS
jgi:hypothetical protein